MMIDRFPPHDGDLDDAAEDGSTRVLLGAFIAAALIVAGSLLVARGELPGIPLESLRNRNYATGAGLMAIGAGVFLHFRVFWQHQRPDLWYVTLGQIVGLLTLIGGAVMVGLRFFRFI